MSIENGKLIIGQSLEDMVREDLGADDSLVVHKAGELLQVGDAETNLFIGFDPTADNPVTPYIFVGSGRGYDAQQDNFDQITGFIGNIVQHPNGGGAVIGTDPNNSFLASIKTLYEAGKLQILEEKHLWQLQTYVQSWDPSETKVAVNQMIISGMMAKRQHRRV